MPFMKPQYAVNLHLDEKLGCYLEEPTIYTTPATGHFARLSAPGFMDATDWLGPFETRKEAEQALIDELDVCPACGEDCPIPARDVNILVQVVYCKCGRKLWVE